METNIYRLEPKGGAAAKSLVILLHGYGANGQDLIGLGQQWQPLFPETAFISPDAPEPCAMNPFGGFQWFDLTLRDPSEYWRGVQKVGPALDVFLTEQMKHYGLNETKTALVGFSQGTMMALHVGLRRAKAFAGIVGYSGKLAGPEQLKNDIKSKPPVLLVHGNADDVLPVSNIEEARAALEANGVKTETHVSPGLGHGIDMKGLELGAMHLKAALC